MNWLRRQNLNLRPLAYEASELPNCSTRAQCVGLLKRKNPHEAGSGHTFKHGSLSHNSVPDSRCNFATVPLFTIALPKKQVAPFHFVVARLQRFLHLLDAIGLALT